MAQNVYECLFILDSNKYARDASGVSGALNSAVEELGGSVLASRLWAEQRLAYPIDGHRKGTYWLSYFRLDSLQLQEFKRVCSLNENILRQMILKVDPRLVEVLVAHAQGKETRLSRRPEEPAAEADDVDDLVEVGADSDE